MQRSNHGSTQDELEELRERHARLKSSGDGHVDSTSRVDHLNDRLIARHQEVDQILAASVEEITRPQRQLLQLGVAQVRQLCPESRARVLSQPAALNVDLLCPCPRIIFSSCGLGWCGFGHRSLVTVRLHCMRVPVTRAVQLLPETKYLVGVPAPLPRPTTDAAFDEAWGVMLKALVRALKPPYGSSSFSESLRHSPGSSSPGHGRYARFRATAHATWKDGGWLLSE
jgi:hypothetical protein